MNNKKLNYFGFQMDNLSMDETIDLINFSINNNNNIHHVVLNVAKLVNSRKNKLLSDSIKSADLINIDGSGIIYGMKLLGLEPKEKVAGIDLMYNLLFEAQKNNYSIYFLGATDRVLKLMLFNFNNEFPNLNIVGFNNGYWLPDEEVNIVNDISSKHPNILFIGISSPKKEIFIKEHKDNLRANFIMGVGGSFDIYAGKTKRAPNLMKKYGMEWIYRIYQEPKRMWKRYLVTNTIYILLIVKKYFLGMNE